MLFTGISIADLNFDKAQKMIKLFHYVSFLFQFSNSLKKQCQ